MSKNLPILQSYFDPARCRHIADGETLVLHCHHFASLITQLAGDCSLLDGKKLLAECAEDAFYKVLKKYYESHGVTDVKERIWAAERYFAECGLGKLKVKYAGQTSGEVELKHSHVDEGWLKKWGKSDKPVNHIGRGYVTALMSAVFEKPKRSFEAVERQSIVCGADYSVITVTDAVNAGKEGN